MIIINLERIKKAFFHPKAVILYFKSYLDGQFLRFTSKKKIDLPSQILKNKTWGGKKLYKAVCTDAGLQYFIKRKEPKFFGEGFLEELINQDFVIDNADRICNNEFTFLGINPKVLKSIKWNQDIKSGHIWPNLFYLDLREKLVQSYNKGWEIKMVWELSRFQYMIPLALAFYKTGEGKYLKKWQELILDWIEKNPVYFGPNWINAMEAAIRVCNWIFSFEIIRYRIHNTQYRIQKEILEKFLSSLVEHGKFIYRNLEYTLTRSNHYLSNIVGLVYLGIMFPEFKESKKWLNKGLKALEEEMKFQVYNDGVDYELSISYHRYVTELFLWAGWLYLLNQNSKIPPALLRNAKRAGKNQNENLKSQNLEPEFWKKLKKMVEFSLAYTKPNELAPQIGDSDDARLHLVWEDFYNWDKRDHFALFKLYNYVFSNKNVIASEALAERGDLKRDCFASARNDIKKTRNDIKKPCNDSKSFSDAGFYIMRDEDFYLITGRNKCCYGKGGSHIHNDILSFELSMFGDDFIIDPGTYTYTADFKLRNRFRRTRAHNTIMIDHQEQNPIFKDPFYIEQKTELTVNRWENGEKEIILDAEHNGYEKLKCPVIHNRIFSFNKKEKILSIKDKFKGRGDHGLEWNFHLSPLIKIWVKEVKSEQREIILIGSKESLIFSAPKILNCVIIEDKVSPSYRAQMPAKTIRFSGFLKQGFPKEYAFTFLPLK